MRLKESQSLLHSKMMVAENFIIKNPLCSYYKRNMPFLFLYTGCILPLYYAYLMLIELTKHQILMQIKAFNTLPCCQYQMIWEQKALPYGFLFALKIRQPAPWSSRFIRRDLDQAPCKRNENIHHEYQLQYHHFLMRTEIFTACKYFPWNPKSGTLPEGQ